MKGVRRRRHKKVAPLPSTRINELQVSDQYVNEKEQSLLVRLNNEVEGDQSIWVKSCVICFWGIHPIRVARAVTMSLCLHLKKTSNPKHTRVKFNLETLKESATVEAFQATIGGKCAPLSILEKED